MKTKKVRLYIDAYPGWHDVENPCLMLSSTPPTYPKGEDNRRFHVDIDLPCFGGSADSETINQVSIVTEVEE